MARLTDRYYRGGEEKKPNKGVVAAQTILSGIGSAANAIAQVQQYKAEIEQKKIDAEYKKAMADSYKFDLGMKKFGALRDEGMGVLHRSGDKAFNEWLKSDTVKGRLGESQKLLPGYSGDQLNLMMKHENEYLNAQVKQMKSQVALGRNMANGLKINNDQFDGMFKDLENRLSNPNLTREEYKQIKSQYDGFRGEFLDIYKQRMATNRAAQNRAGKAPLSNRERYIRDYTAGRARDESKSDKNAETRDRLLGLGMDAEKANQLAPSTKGSFSVGLADVQNAEEVAKGADMVDAMVRDGATDEQIAEQISAQGWSKGTIAQLIDYLNRRQGAQ